MNKKDSFIKKIIKNFTNNLRTSIPILFFVFIVVWGYFFFVFYQIDVFFEIQKNYFNNKNTPDYIPEIFFRNKKYRLFEDQQKWIDENIKQIKIIEDEMNDLFPAKKLEQAIIFCFDKNKELIYCTKNENHDHYYYDITDLATEESVVINLTKIELISENNKDFAYFINIHNHPNNPGNEGIHLPSETDLKTSIAIKRRFNQKYWFSLIWAEPKKQQWICEWKHWSYYCSFPDPTVWYGNSLEHNCDKPDANASEDQKTKCKKFSVSSIFEFFKVKKNYIIYE